jgi:hypothetical protein
MSRIFGLELFSYLYSENDTSAVGRELTGRIQSPYFPSLTTSFPAIQLPPILKEFAKQTMRLKYAIPSPILRVLIYSIVAQRLS